MDTIAERGTEAARAELLDRPDGSIRQELRGLADDVGTLVALAGELRDRLAPVLIADDEPRDGHACRAVPTGAPELLGEIVSIRDNLEVARYLLASTFSRVDL